MFWGTGAMYWVLRPVNKYHKQIRSPELSSQLSHCDLVWCLLSGPQQHLARLLLQGLKG